MTDPKLPPQLRIRDSLPGLSKIGPNQAPNGLVVHVYSMDGDLLYKRLMPAPANLEDMTPEDMDAAWDALCIEVSMLAHRGDLPNEVAFIIYDGDTGMRVSVQDFE